MAAVSAALKGGAVAVQYRRKGGAAAARRQDVDALLACCRPRGVPVIVNDDLELAAASASAGVHLGRDDATCAEARARLGPGAVIGVSCYNRPDLAVAARAAGADYVAFGRFFPSRTKPAAVGADAALLRRARPLVDCPVVAIGGITAENGAPLVAAGADLLAVIDGVFGAPDIRAAAAAFGALFPRSVPGGP